MLGGRGGYQPLPTLLAGSTLEMFGYHRPAFAPANITRCEVMYKTKRGENSKL